MTSVHSHCTRWGKNIFRSLVAQFKSTNFNVVKRQLNSFVTFQFDLSETTQVLFLQTRVLIGARKTLMRLLFISLDKKRCVSTYQSLARFMTGLASLTNTCIPVQKIQNLPQIRHHPLLLGYLDLPREKSNYRLMERVIWCYCYFKFIGYDKAYLEKYLLHEGSPRRKDFKGTSHVRLW